MTLEEYGSVMFIKGRLEGVEEGYKRGVKDSNKIWRPISENPKEDGKIFIAKNDKGYLVFMEWCNGCQQYKMLFAEGERNIERTECNGFIPTTYMMIPEWSV